MADTYCSADDLSLGGLTVPRFMTAAQEIDKAADEINALLGQVYRLPIVFDQNNPAQNADKLLLKIINARLAAGSIFLGAASAGDDDELNAYGKYLRKMGEDLLQTLLNGSRSLEGVPHLNEGEDSHRTGPILVNKDATSAVDNFYDGQYANGLRPDPSPFYYGGRVS